MRREGKHRLDFSLYSEPGKRYDVSLMGPYDVSTRGCRGIVEIELGTSNPRHLDRQKVRVMRRSLSCRYDITGDLYT